MGRPSDCSTAFRASYGAMSCQGRTAFRPHVLAMYSTTRPRLTVSFRLQVSMIRDILRGNIAFPFACTARTALWASSQFGLVPASALASSIQIHWSKWMAGGASGRIRTFRVLGGELGGVMRPYPCLLG